MITYSYTLSAGGTDPALQPEQLAAEEAVREGILSRVQLRVIRGELTGSQIRLSMMEDERCLHELLALCCCLWRSPGQLRPNQ
jgi:hypothetical protein